MRAGQALAVIVCVAIVLAAYLAWDRATSNFNPSPGTVSLNTGTSCSPSSPPCPAFGIYSANLSVKTALDITSQELTLTVTASGPSRISGITVYFSGVPIGNLTRVILPGQSTSGGWAIPTTLNVTVGKTYEVSVSAQYVDPSSGKVSAQYWSSKQVVAV
ncbi:MAG TPA: hypothetical protein VKF15_03505 [Nitrososphaerales archaeon]|nr:hypothetical protein [Nitrososphaerales archaeon]